MLVDVRLFEPKNQQGAEIQSSRRGWGSSGTANGLVRALSLSLYRSRLWYKRRLNELDTLESPADSLQRQKEPSELWSLFYIPIEVERTIRMDENWYIIRYSPSFSLPVSSFIPLFHHAGYGYNPFAVLVLRNMISETLCREEGCTYNIVSLAPRSRQPLSHFARLPDAFNTY